MQGPQGPSSSITRSIQILMCTPRQGGGKCTVGSVCSAGGQGSPGDVSSEIGIVLGTICRMASMSSC